MSESRSSLWCCAKPLKLSSAKLRSPRASERTRAFFLRTLQAARRRRCHPTRMCCASALRASPYADCSFQPSIGLGIHTCMLSTHKADPGRQKQVACAKDKNACPPVSTCIFLASGCHTEEPWKVSTLFPAQAVPQEDFSGTSQCVDCHLLVGSNLACLAERQRSVNGRVVYHNTRSHSCWAVRCSGRVDLGYSKVCSCKEDARIMNIFPDGRYLFSQVEMVFCFGSRAARSILHTETCLSRILCCGSWKLLLFCK